jgi:carboxymethylenebutenolidase
VILEASDGHTLDAYQALPAGAARGGVVIVQEIFGLNHHIRSVVDQYAEAGYVALAPAIFDRARPGVELGYTPEGTQEGRALRTRIGWEAPLLDIAAAAREVSARTGHAPAVIGYCWGGSLAWLAAACGLEVACAVAYYGGQIAQLIRESPERPRVPVLLHFGERDALIPASDVEAIRRAHPAAEVFVYPAGHGFNCTERADHSPASAAEALERTLAFLQRHLDRSG